jgi:acetyl-CoA carboxylase beta subunit
MEKRFVVEEYAETVRCVSHITVVSDLSQQGANRVVATRQIGTAPTDDHQAVIVVDGSGGTRLQNGKQSAMPIGSGRVD